jgi:uncharacterized protein (TIGR02266 family)
MGEDQRVHQRHAVITEVRYAADGVSHWGRLSDLSLGGVFIDTINPLEMGVSLTFEFVLPGDSSGKPISGEGVVAWHQPMMGMGIRFTRLTPEDQERIRRCICAP